LNFDGADETYESHCSHHPPDSRFAYCTWPCYGAAFCYVDHNRARPAADAITAADSADASIIAAAESTADSAAAIA
jgi:hypothetical protein